MSFTNGLDNPELYFQTKLYTGDGSATQAQTFDGSEDMQPDWVWIKSRSNTEAHSLTDSVRGVTKWLESDSTAAEQTNANTMKAFGTDGFSVGLAGSVGDTGQTYVAWCWKGGTTSGITTDGSTTITPSGYSFNQTAAISIVKFAGNETSGAKLAHGLGAVPSLMIFKQLSGTGSNGWNVYHQSLGNTKYILMNTTAAAVTTTNRWNDTTPDSVNVTLGSSDGVSVADGDMVAYIFAEKQGFSKFGSYVGTANADGPFIYTGFRPAFIIIKNINGQAWNMWDNKRNPFNLTQKNLQPNVVAAENDGSAPAGQVLDMLSNGFKIRSNENENNQSGVTHVYMAFAESPFCNSSGVPNNGR